jgi:DNA-binding NarL/FixJ family response regulator
MHGDPDVVDRRVGDRTLMHASSVIRVMIVDDHPAVREALSSAIDGKSGVTVAGEATSLDEARALCESLRPDVVVIDIAMEELRGLDLVAEVRREWPEVEVVVYSMFYEASYAEAAVRAGARGYVMKSDSSQLVVEAILNASMGQIYLSPRLAARIMSKLVYGRRSAAARGD